MTLAQVIGFPEGDSGIARGLAANGCRTRPVRRASELQPDRAVFLCGDSPGWLDLLHEVRALHPRIFMVVVTRVPDSSRWLDALEAGADDYCSLPMDRQQVQWLMQSFRSGFACS